MISRVLLMGFICLMASCLGAQSKKESIAQTSGGETQSEVIPVSASKEDTLFFQKLMVNARDQQWDARSFSEIMVAVAKEFLGIPYVAHTLESDGPEQLIVNLRALDCTTFAENVLASSLCIARQEYDFRAFARQLQQIRYRGGVIDQYPSRLHYFTDWLIDNQKKGLVKIVSNQLGDADFNGEVNFMSTHSDKYKALTLHPEWVDVMEEVEKQISAFPLKYVTGNHIDEVASQIEDGDLIGFCSTVSDLDVSHVAIAVHLEDGLHFIHASSRGKEVELSSVLLSEYVNSSRGIYGILLGRSQK